MEECGWALVKCCYECGVCVPRPQLVEHELHLCPKRPVDVKLESAMTKMEERHKREMDTVREEFRREMDTVREEFRREMVTVKEDLCKEIERKDQEIASVKKDFQREIERKNQEMTVVKKDFSREMEKSMNEEFKKKDQEIAAMEEKFRRQVDRGEQVTEKLAEQIMVCFNISINIQFMYYMMCPYLVSGVYQQDEGDGGITGEADTRDER